MPVKSSDSRSSSTGLILAGEVVGNSTEDPLPAAAGLATFGGAIFSSLFLNENKAIVLLVGCLSDDCSASANETGRLGDPLPVMSILLESINDYFVFLVFHWHRCRLFGQKRLQEEPLQKNGSNATLAGRDEGG